MGVAREIEVATAAGADSLAELVEVVEAGIVAAETPVADTLAEEPVVVVLLKAVDSTMTEEPEGEAAKGLETPDLDLSVP